MHCHAVCYVQPNARTPAEQQHNLCIYGWRENIVNAHDKMSVSVILSVDVDTETFLSNCLSWWLWTWPTEHSIVASNIYKHSMRLHMHQCVCLGGQHGYPKFSINSIAYSLSNVRVSEVINKRRLQLLIVLFSIWFSEMIILKFRK